MPHAPDLQAAIQSALADAARASGVDAGQLRLVSAERVTWSDGSLGCPQPGRLYTQALVPGYRIRIEARGELLHYHAGLRGAPVRCPPGRSSNPVIDDGRT